MVMIRQAPCRPWQDWTPDDFTLERLSYPKACVVRYGGFGDMIMAASLFPVLKEQGYSVVVNTTERGADLLKSDPNVDLIIRQRTEQVPNFELPEYWNYIEKWFDKFVNLSESVEGRLLPVKGMPEYELSHEERHKRLNRNYLDETHKIAGIPFKPGAARFYPTKKERKWAKQKRIQANPNHFCILWSLSGSSVHKIWPWMDQAIARILTQYKDVRIVLVGDDSCRLLEQGWDMERRIWRKSGKWSIRQTLAFAQRVDLVIGTETGVLNAVGQEPNVDKIVILSHSSRENLTKHWESTEVLEPHVACYPCHQMHYGFRYCHQDEVTHAAICAASVDVDQVYNAIVRSRERWNRVQQLRQTVVR